MTLSPFLFGLLAGAVCTAVAHVVLPATRPQGSSETANDRAGHGLWAGLFLATAVLAWMQKDLPVAASMKRGAGPSLWPLLVAALPIAASALWSDFRRPRSERHALGLAGSGVGLYLAGFSIFILTSPLHGGTVDVLPVWQVVVTVMWLFLLASIVELVSLVPMGVALLGLALSGVVIFSGGPQQSVASYGLAGIVAGSILGRGLAGRIPSRRVGWSKAEVFALGFWLTAMTNVSFLKSVALAGFVLPLGALAVGIIVITLSAFERSLILRSTPRAE